MRECFGVDIDCFTSREAFPRRRNSSHRCSTSRAKETKVWGRTDQNIPEDSRDDPMPFIHVPIDILKQEKLEKYLPFCFKCSNCQFCPVTLFSEGYDPLESYVYDMISSLDPTTNPNLWKCAACHHCELVCPYGISPEKIILAFKEIAFAEGKAPKDVVDLVKQVSTTGRGFVVTQRTHRLRRDLGLLPLTDKQKFDVQQLAKRIGIDVKSDSEVTKR